MKTTGRNISIQLTPDQVGEMYFEAATIPYTRTKEEVWGEIEVITRDVKTHGFRDVKTHGWRHVETHGRASLLHAPGRASLLFAASVIVLLGIVGFLGFYTKTITTGNGEHITATLPDQSTVILNAQSTLKYYPYRWFVSRNVEFSGEGFFEVTKGSKFVVGSSNGKTVVLGTNFNVFSREAEYKVTCFTGKVKVVSPTADEVVLTADYHAEIGQNGKILVTKLDDPNQKTGWKESMYNFTSTPLQLVIQEIERQYNISVILNTNFEFVYTGYFSKDKPVEEVLNLICKPFGLTFVKKSDKQYLISQQ